MHKHMHHGRAEKIMTNLFLPTPRPHLPRHAPCLHGVGQCDIVGPDVKLPLVQTNETREDRASVDTNTHTQVIASVRSNTPAGQGGGGVKGGFPFPLLSLLLPYNRSVMPDEEGHKEWTLVTYMHQQIKLDPQHFAGTSTKSSTFVCGNS